MSETKIQTAEDALLHILHRRSLVEYREDAGDHFGRAPDEQIQRIADDIMIWAVTLGLTVD